MQFPISIELHRPRLLNLFLVLFHILAVGCIIAVPWLWPLRAVLLVAVALSAFYSLHSLCISCLCLTGPEKIDCLLADGQRIEATLLSGCTVFSHLIVLRLHLGGEKKVINLPLLPDQLSAEAFRLLRLWLRWKTGESKPHSGKIV